ncbi:MAG: aspartate aminotransferase family protein [Elusimicrobiota bacterium]|jgi:predicted acetylornithine/succinylornithine family transaminase|nr:aspartate aminotransferase family protein [Elusimicrobiota bacterium]
MNIKQTEEQYFMKTYKRADLIVKKAKNQFIWDTSGKKYLDFFSGISVCNLGHSHPAVIKAAKKQLNDFAHISNLYYAPSQIELGKELIKKGFGKRVFFSNSGAEANECAIKIARKRGLENGGRYEIISFKKSFHGRTLAALAATGQEKFHAPFKPMIEKFVFADFNDIESVKNLISDKTCAIMAEVIQGEGGIAAANAEFLKGLRQICDENNLLLIFDEIQCGMGRTGKFYAFQNFDIKPDIATLAKSLANGLPLAATIAQEKAEDIFHYGDHGSTFGGNPVSCAAALAVLKTMDAKFLNNVLKMSKYLREQLAQLAKKHNCIKEILGIGLMLGIALDKNGKDIVGACLKKGLIINCVQDTIIRLLPPLTITNKDADAAVKILDEVLNQ